MIYLFIQVTPPYDRVKDFNDYWGRESLPYWITQGAKHIGSYQYLAGGPVNEIVRLFEFDDLTHYQRYQQWLTGSDEGKELLKQLSRFKYTLTQRFLSPVYPLDLVDIGLKPSLYALYTVTPELEKAREFDEFWGRESLPFHLKNGVGHVGSFHNYVGGYTHEVIRLFSFDNYAHRQRFGEALQSGEGKDLMRRLEPFVSTLSQQLMVSIY